MLLKIKVGFYSIYLFKIYNNLKQSIMPRMIYYYTKDRIEESINNPIRLKKEIKKATKSLNHLEIDVLSNWLFKSVNIDIDAFLNNQKNN